MLNNTIVAFLDILGYKKIVKNISGNAEAVKCLDDTIYGITKDLFEKFKDSDLNDQTEEVKKLYIDASDAIKVRVAYDNIIITTALPSSDDSQKVLSRIYTFFSIMTAISTLFIHHTGSTLRGGISLGPHYESERDDYLFIFSEAHNNAVDLERKAFYPRILLDKSLISYLEEKNPDYIEEFLYEDVDGWWCLDIYSYLYKLENLEKIRQTLSEIKHGLMTNIQGNANDENALTKLKYFAGYHNRKVCGDGWNFPDLTIPRLKNTSGGPRMELMEAIRRRQAIRKYRPEPVPQKYIDQILEAARLAPSGVNSQPWKFKVVTDPGLKEKIFQCSKNQFHIRQAPVVIVVCGDTMSYSKSLKARFKELLDNGVITQSDLGIMGLKDLITEDDEKELEKYKQSAAFNTAIATEHMALMAASLGLGSCWIHLFDKDALANLLVLPSWVFPVTLLAVGYPDETPERKPRKSLPEIIF